MANGDVTRRDYSHSAGSLTIEILALANSGTIEVQLPKNTSRPTMVVYDDTSNANAIGYIAAVGHNGVFDPATQKFTYTNNTGGAFTGWLILNFVAG